MASTPSRFAFKENPINTGAGYCKVNQYLYTGEYSQQVKKDYFIQFDRFIYDIAWITIKRHVYKQLFDRIHRCICTFAKESLKNTVDMVTKYVQSLCK